MKYDKSIRGSASQFFVAGELCRRGHVAVVTLGNTPNTDILCSNVEGTKFVHIQVKTFVPGNRTCSVGLRAEINYGYKFFWIICGIPKQQTDNNYQYFIIPSKDMAAHIKKDHRLWLDTPGLKGQSHKDNSVRVVNLPPYKSFGGWNIRKYKERWDLIEKRLKATG